MVFQPELQYEGGRVLLKPITLRGESVTDLSGITISGIGGRFSYIYEIPFTPELEHARLVVNSVVVPARSARRNSPTTVEEAMALRNARVREQTTLASGVNIIPQDDTNLVADAGQQEDNLTGAGGQGRHVAGAGSQRNNLTATDGLQGTSFANTGLALGVNTCPDTDRVFVKSVLFFERSVSRLDLNYQRNRTEQVRLARETMDEFLKTGQKIASVRILGYASPEGDEFLNLRLGIERTRAGERFFREHTRRAVDEVIVEYMGEDWDGFLAAVRVSNIRNRNAILRVFQDKYDRASRERELRNMLRIYPELQEVILPSLRRVEIIVEFVNTNE